MDKKYILINFSFVYTVIWFWSFYVKGSNISTKIVIF